ncbi:MAG: argininosuccinate lyase [Anaerolineae bacterium]
MSTSSSFPHPIYRDHVLIPAYEGASAHLFGPMLAANRTHAVMLATQNIISAENAKALLNAIDQVDEAGIEALTYQPGIEDLFFHVEGRIIEICGPEFGGNLQLARSRNDLGHTLARLAIRPTVLDLFQRSLDLRKTVLALAYEHLDTVMPGYTHTQPAQPTTFAHYLGGVLSFLERDSQRLLAAFRTVNQSPLGAAAFTGTGFDIDRELSATLLGFDGVMVSSQDCIGASDHLTDIASALSSLAINLSRMTHDLLFKATRESGAIRIDDSFIQISSIMPQKRNPVVLEHLRARLSRLLGMAQIIVTQCHNIPYGDTQDIEDEIEPTTFGAIQTAADILELYESVFATLKLNVPHLLSEAAAGFTTVTELADTLVREAKLPFRSAHHVVSQLVQQLYSAGLDVEAITPQLIGDISENVLGERVELAVDVLNKALDPVAFVAGRAVLGGAAASATRNLLNAQVDQLAVDVSWLAQENNRLAQAAAKLVKAAQAYQ